MCIAAMCSGERFRSLPFHMNVAGTGKVHDCFGDTGISRETQRGRNVYSMPQTDYAVLKV